jgi:hypothetical protein
MIIAVTQEAIQILAEIFTGLREIRLGERQIPINSGDFAINDATLGYSSDPQVYKFNSFWLGLNEKNYHLYRETTDWDERRELLGRSLTNNLLSLAKGLDCWLAPDEKIITEVNLRPVRTRLKGTEMTGFSGMFKTNFLIPNHLGIGKSVSRGFGTVSRVF